MGARVSSIRKTIFLNLSTEHWPLAGISLTNKMLLILVITSVVSAVMETEKSLTQSFASAFYISNMTFQAIFTIEYVARIWSSVEDPKYSGFVGRVRYMFTPMAIIDLLAFAPLWFGAGSELLLIRLARLARIIKLGRIPGISAAMNRMAEAVLLRKFELYISVGLALTIMLLASTAMYFLEGTTQPEAFGSIPRALWWGMATLTTVGYGDIYPITVGGQICAGIVAFAGIGLIAMPTGILAAAFSNAFQKSE